MNTDAKIKILKVITLAQITFFVVCSPAYADSALPMIFIVWPYSWLLLILVIPLEALVAVRILKFDYKRGLELATAANLASTTVGIPVTWFILFLLQRKFGGENWSFDTPWEKILTVALQSPLMMPKPVHELAWMVPAAVASFCVPFFFVSVAVEYFAAKTYWRGSIDLKLWRGPVESKLLLKWAWIANLVSYGIIIVGLLTIALVAARTPPVP